MVRTRERDSGTLQYDWFFAEDGSECVLRERYRDFAAVLEHAVNLAELIPGIVAVSDPDVEIYGSPTAELLGALAGLAPRVFSGLWPGWRRGSSRRSSRSDRHTA